MANTGTAPLMPFPVPAATPLAAPHTAPQAPNGAAHGIDPGERLRRDREPRRGAAVFGNIDFAVERVLAHPGVANFMRAWGIVSPDRLVLPFAAAFALAAVLAGAFRLLVLWISTRIAYATGADFSSEVYRRTLYQPYRVQVASNSSDVISSITGKIGDTVSVLTSVLTLLSSIIVLIFITATLFAIDSLVALGCDRRVSAAATA